MDTLLEEVDELMALIEITPELPYAHFAHHQAALARQILETALVRLDDGLGDGLGDELGAPNNVILPLKILRTIAFTKTKTTLHNAIKAGDVGLVWLMIQSEQIDDSSVSLACEFDYLEIVRLLIAHSANSAADNYRGLRIACKKGCTEVARFLLEFIDVPPAILTNILQQACGDGHSEIVRLLLNLPLERGVNPVANGNIAILYASGKGDLEIVRQLIERGADANIAFKNACFFNHSNVARLLLELPLEYGVNPAENDNNALIHAVSYGYTDIVRLLLDLPLGRGVDVTACEKTSISSIKFARRAGYTDIAQMLYARLPWYHKMGSMIERFMDD